MVIRNKNEINLSVITTTNIDTNNTNMNTKPKIYEISCDIIIYCGKVIVKMIKFFIQVSGVYLMWILLHYFASQLYVKLCTPSDIFGLLMSPFLSSTPYCQGLRWVIYNGAVMINNMWIVLATWLCANVFILNNIVDNNNNRPETST